MAVISAIVAELQIPEGYTTRKNKAGLKVVPAKQRKAAQKPAMQCTAIVKEKKMVKVLIETGSESHTTSSASVVAKYVGGPNDGKMMYEVKNLIVNTRWYDSNNKSKRWVETTFQLPEGTQFEIIGKGRTGARGADRHEFHKVFVVSANEEVLETTIDVGLRDADLKGRVRVVKDVLATRKQAAEAARTEGF